MNLFSLLLLCSLQTDTLPAPPQPGVLFVVNGRAVDTAALAGAKFRRMKPVTGPQAVKLYGARARNGVVIIELEKEWYNLFGLISDAKGKPLANATVLTDGAKPDTVKTDACGHFYLPNVAAGTRLVFSRKGFEDQYIDVYARPNDMLRVQLRQKK